jgi:hypothetical protein
MKKLAFLFIFFPFVTFAQRVVVLSVTQPPEFGFSVSQSDTTILETTSVELGTDIVISGGSGDYQFLWTPGKTLSDSTILNPVATPMDTTIYLLTVTDEFGCSFSVNYTVNVRGPIVGIDAFNDQSTLVALLFPNPNNGKFKVQLSGEPQERIKLSIIENSGKILKQQIINNFIGRHTEELDIKLPNGAYTLLILGDNQRVQRQFIIN